MSVHIREKETGLIGMLLQLCFTMSLTRAKPSRCVLLKDTSDSYCVYKVNDAVLASFLFANSECNSHKSRVAQRVLCRHHHSVYTARIV